VSHHLDLEGLLADPPLVHPRAEGGVWRTATDCYAFLAQHAAGGRSIETGLGVSTVVLLQAGEHHTSLFRFPDEGERLLAYCAERQIDVSGLQLIAGPSHETLPRLAPPEPVDVVFIDGGHGFPMPILDWFFCGRHLKAGGHLVVDDVQLPACAILAAALDADARWPRVAGTRRWAAYRREVEYDLSDDHDRQPLTPVRVGASTMRALARAQFQQTGSAVLQRLRA
jgi:predicted O-methyltransferase YrrM